MSIHPRGKSCSDRFECLFAMTLRCGAKYVFLMTTWHVWFAITCLTLSPWFFHPQSFKVGCCRFIPVLKPPACSAWN